MRVAIVGASDNPESYSNRAVRELVSNGHEAVPVNPALERVEGIAAFKSLSDVPGPLDTVTLYVRAAVSSKIEKEILAKMPKRLIFNPGTENDALEKSASAAGIQTLRACTLVMLSTGQF